MIGAYALSGMIAGIFQKFGKVRGNSRVHTRKWGFSICSNWKYSEI